jgi:uncharacterized lipoprotein YddW (UPF0748 family)
MQFSRMSKESGWGWLLLAFNFSVSPFPCAHAAYVAANVTPPAPLREFRGAWVATVGNIDWPSKAGLTSEQQKAELLSILDRAVQLKLNAILLQVRPACDAFYVSAIEPWSEYLTGRMGQAPIPFYDPLGFAVEEAHKRGLELHAWFNPFRARHLNARSAAAAHHISKTRPQWVRQYGRTLWLDPGEAAARDYSIRVILDVTRRYDIDGVHLDDYFYPYQEEDAAGNALTFPDGPGWKHYQEAGGKLSRDDWRRANIDVFIERLYRSIKSEKPLVKFGVSPFGIWRPGFPQPIDGYDAYDKLYTDSRKWLMNGWVDYFAPQLYWSIDPPEQSYPVLLKWWSEQNVRKRHLWPGNAISRNGRTADEIVNQIRLTRKQSGATGNIFWSFKSFLRNRSNIVEALSREVYSQPALVPASPWLDNTAPGMPRLTVTKDASTKVSWQPSTAEPVWLWMLQTKAGNEWRLEILPSRQHAQALAQNVLPDVIVVTAIDRCGNASMPAVVARQDVVPKP